MSAPQPPRHRHRWPSKQAAGPPRPRPADVEQAALAAIGDLTRAVQSLAPVVLDVSTFQLDANGQATKQFRVRFAAVAVTSGSLAALTIASGPPQVAAPGPGPGAGQVPALGFAAHNIAGTGWTVYGGSPGEVVTVATFGRPVPPNSESGNITGTVTAAAFGQASQKQFGTVTNPGAGATVAQIAALSSVGLYQVDWSVSMGAPATGAGDANNMQIQLGGQTPFTAMYPSTAGANPVPQPRLWLRSTNINATLKVAAIAAAAVATSVYEAQIVATLVSA